MAAKHIVWVIGEGPMPKNYAHVLRALGFAANEGGEGPAGAVALFLSYWDSAVQTRARLFHETQRDLERLVVVESPVRPLEDVVRELRAGSRAPSHDDGMLLPLIPQAQERLEGYCHDLKYLFLPATAPSSWYFQHALDRKGACRQRFQTRQEKVESLVRELGALCGNRTEADAVNRLAAFTGTLFATATTADSLHGLLATRAGAADASASAATELIAFGEQLQRPGQLCELLWESRFEHLAPLTHALQRRKASC